MANKIYDDDELVYEHPTIPLQTAVALPNPKGFAIGGKAQCISTVLDPQSGKPIHKINDVIQIHEGHLTYYVNNSSSYNKVS